MRIAALIVAVFTIVIGIVGIVFPDSLTAVRQQYFATPVGLYAAGAFRAAMQALAATFLGPERARAILEWETLQGTTLLRFGAAVALAAGGFVAFAVIGRSRGREQAVQIEHGLP